MRYFFMVSIFCVMSGLLGEIEVFVPDSPKSEADERSSISGFEEATGTMVIHPDGSLSGKVPTMRPFTPRKGRLSKKDIEERISDLSQKIEQLFKNAKGFGDQDDLIKDLDVSKQNLEKIEGDFRRDFLSPAYKKTFEVKELSREERLVDFDEELKNCAKLHEKIEGTIFLTKKINEWKEILTSFKNQVKEVTDELQEALDVTPKLSLKVSALLFEVSSELDNVFSEQQALENDGLIIHKMLHDVGTSLNIAKSRIMGDVHHISRAVDFDDVWKVYGRIENIRDFGQQSGKTRTEKLAQKLMRRLEVLGVMIKSFRGPDKGWAQLMKRVRTGFENTKKRVKKLEQTAFRRAESLP